MKAIINGKRFDTETAILIGEDSGGAEFVTDFDFWSEALYRTRSGAYFLAGSGGASSRFAEALGRGSYIGGEGITPVSPGDAFDWAQTHLSTCDVEQHFGDLITDG